MLQMDGWISKCLDNKADLITAIGPSDIDKRVLPDLSAVSATVGQNERGHYRRANLGEQSIPIT